MKSPDQASGSVRTAKAPPPSWFSSETSPPCKRAISRTMLSPAQPKTAALAAGVGPRQRIESLEDLFGRVGGHAWTGIGYAHHRPTVSHDKVERHRAARRGKLKGVLDQFPHSLQE